MRALARQSCAPRPPSRLRCEGGAFGNGGEALVIHSDIYAGGGAELLCLRAIAILQGLGARVTLVHAGGRLDAARIRAWSGILLDPSRVRFITVPGARQLERLAGSYALLQYALATMWARRIAREFDLVASVFVECPIDHPRVLQYISYPSFFFDRETLRHLGANPRTQIEYWLRAMYHVACRMIASWSREAVRRQRTLANSDWTARQVRRHYGQDMAVETLYPGASVGIGPSQAAFVPFGERENNFVIVGRIDPGKRTELAIEIVRRLREEKGHDVGLHVIGRCEPAAVRRVEWMFAGKPWARWHPDLTREQLEGLVVRQKWGLHCYPFEHYGIAPAELQLLGCIAFVPDDGGQCEIVRDPGLRYRDADDAVAKIDRVLRDRDGQVALLRRIALWNEDHKAQRFVERYGLAVVSLLRQDRRVVASE